MQPYTVSPLHEIKGAPRLEDVCQTWYVVSGARSSHSLVSCKMSRKTRLRRYVGAVLARLLRVGRLDAGRLMRGQLPMAVVFDIDLQRSHPIRLPFARCHILDTRQHGGIAIDIDFDVAFFEGVVVLRSARHGRDVLGLILFL